MNRVAKKRPVGRPTEHKLYGHQARSIRSRLMKEERMSDIAAILGVHPYAVLRIKRQQDSLG